jgi:hypothetical protein
MTPTSQLAGLRAALRLVQRDVDSHPGADPGATTEDGFGGDEADGDPTRVVAGRPAAGPGRFRLVGTEQGFFVALPDGRFWLAGAGPLPLGVEGADAVVAVAVGVQECFAEILWHAWPRCPVHDTTLRAEPRALPDEVIWCCDGGEGHDVAPVGRVGAAVSQVAAAASRTAVRDPALATTSIEAPPVPESKG